ncbi:O-antigen ligase family protein [Maribacter hydrothermalis]|uniref:O-antigen ligase-related domain-containing protein n=1 Tax=Maribacter hydrothermalis TaxID=1836467 RepID=A0A1B7ZE59_9FLAO|nr:O-antigen ligase family protein [Maribacter hydrothermalis]APQ17365.1 hypothetical protein BTR34_08530 [Maribacter hydrothermalis]OBR41843.1 hypothetical protein A9200_00180 [Maribacter hydrothermalis]
MTFIDKHNIPPKTPVGFINNILPFILGLMPILSIVFDEKLVPLYIIILLISYLFEKDKKANFVKNKRYLLPFVIMISVFVIFTLVSSDILLSLKVLERQISFILLPLLVFTADWSRKRLIVFLKTFTFGLSIFCLISFGLLIWFYITNQDWIVTMNQMQNNGTYLLFKFPHLVNTHPTYWSYLLIFGNIIVLSNYFFFFFKGKYIGLLMLLIFNTIILLLASRTPLVINILVFISTFTLLFKYSRKYSNKKLLLMGVVVLGLVVFVAPNINLLKIKTADSFNDDRFYLWPIALDQIKNNYYVLGEGLGLGNSMLKEYIIENGDMRKNYNSFDLHNQYLRHYLDMGILGLGSLVYFIFSPLMFKRNVFYSPDSFLTISLVLLLSLACITEAPLYRLKGIVVFSIFYPIFLIAGDNLKLRKEIV